MHEVAPDVEVHGITAFRPVQRGLADVLLQSGYTVMRAASLYAGIRVGNECALKELVGISEV